MAITFVFITILFTFVSSQVSNINAEQYNSCSILSKNCAWLNALSSFEREDYCELDSPTLTRESCPGKLKLN